MEEKRLKLGLALSGAAARSVFYLGFLEVLQENNIPVEVIAAQSGASIVAASYACGTLDRLKKDMLALDWKKLRGLLKPFGKGGLYSLEYAEEYLRTHITLSKHFEELKTKLCFVATNLETGRVVPLVMGDVARSMRITCSVPGLFEPVKWGNQVLVDGGILSIIPAQLAREAGADVVLGVSVRSTKHVFLPSHIKLRRLYNLVKTHSYGKVANYLRKAVSPEGVEGYIQDPLHDDDAPGYSMLKTIGRSLDLAIDISKKEAISNDAYWCDMTIHEGEGRYGDSVNISKSQGLYEDGRRSALENLSAIRKLIETGKV